MSHIKTLEGLLRDRAEKELEAEAKRRFDAVTGYFYSAGDGGNRLVIEVGHYSGVTTRTDARTGKEVYDLDILKILNLLETKAVSNKAQQWGDTAVKEFLERADTLANEIADLRNHVTDQ